MLGTEPGVLYRGHSALSPGAVSPALCFHLLFGDEVSLSFIG